MATTKEEKVFPQSAVDVDPAIPTSVSDRFDQPGKGFTTKTVTVKMIQMSNGFDANGIPGNTGDWLVWYNGHWHIFQEV